MIFLHAQQEMVSQPGFLISTLAPTLISVVVIVLVNVEVVDVEVVNVDEVVAVVEVFVVVGIRRTNCLSGRASSKL